MTRQNANRRLVEMLDSLVEAYPDMRFTQILHNADVIKAEANPNGAPTIVNEYALESKELLERVRNSKIWEAP